MPTLSVTVTPPRGRPQTTRCTGPEALATLAHYAANPYVRVTITKEPTR